MEKTFEELIEDAIDKKDYSSPKSNRYYGEEFLFDMMHQVREATKSEAVNINNEVVLFNMGIDLESDVDFRDSNAEILNLPTDRIKITE